MCNHSNTMKVNDIKVCLDCGFTLTWDNKIIFDRKIVGYKPKKRKGCQDGKK